MNKHILRKPMRVRTLSQLTVIATAWLGVMLIGAAPAEAAFPKLALEPVSVGELVAPVGIENAGDGSGRLFTIDQRGLVNIIDSADNLLATPFLDIESLLVPQRAGFDERGLLGMAFHPDYGMANTFGEDKFYVYYSAPDPGAPGTAADAIDHMAVIAEFSAAPGSNVADPNSQRILLTVQEPQFNHDGGDVAFGPDGMLYIALGDGGSSNDNDAGHTGGDPNQPNGVLGNAQDRTNLLGSILRIDVEGNNGPGGQYGIPADNPFVGDGGGVREEIFAYGLRNPWRFSFDDGPGGTGELFVADVGQSSVEEVSIVGSGDNMGWRVKEGSFDFDPNTPLNDPNVMLVDPIAEYSRAGNALGLPAIGRTVVGGHVYRGSASPELDGKYIFGDWSDNFVPGNGTLLGLEDVGGGNWDLSVLAVLGGNPIGEYLIAFGEDENGELYALTRQQLAAVVDSTTGHPTAAVYRLVVVPTPAAGGAGLGLVAVLAARRRRRC